MWHPPTPVWMTGTRAFSTTLRISPAPPRGMSTSRYSVRPISSLALSRLVSATRATQSRGSPASSRASRMTATMAELEWKASFPPRRMTALPDLRQRAAASTVTLGRAS